MVEEYINQIGFIRKKKMIIGYLFFCTQKAFLIIYDIFPFCHL